MVSDGNTISLLNQLLLKTRNTNQTLETFTVCFDHLGCISTTEEWFHPIYRPHNVRPLDRHTINTQFNVVTKASITNSSILNLDFTQIKNGTELCGPSCSGKLVILIHDFTSNGFTGWHLAAVYIEQGDITVASVDWQAGAEPPFEQAISNARVVALEIIAFLKDAKRKDSSICLIGHGVGAHIAGYVGHTQPVSKIIGLDPTGPYFENMPTMVRLDPSDAHWVEVIHTDAFSARSQGTHTIMGHFDFFVNGANQQPHCNESSPHVPKFTKLDRNSLKEGDILPACSHKRAFKYFIEAIQNEDCEYVGFECTNYKNFLEGKCLECINKTKAVFTKIGATERYSKKNGVSYFLKTAESSPFCLNPYKLKIYFEEKSHGLSSERSGSFELIMVNQAGIIASAHPSSEIPIAFNTKGPYMMIYYGKQPLITDLAEVRLKWIHNPNSLCVFCNNNVYIQKVVVQLVTLSNEKTRGQVYKMCPTQETVEVKSGAFITLTKCKEKTHIKKETS
ncbi:hypothetical protein FQR65_LT02925 [Abscondita terminalis]|nr:hypothetical protein FQR65_LT02925 [Abscondita terminalis]